MIFLFPTSSEVERLARSSEPVLRTSTINLPRSQLTFEPLRLFSSQRVKLAIPHDSSALSACAEVPSVSVHVSCRGSVYCKQGVFRRSPSVTSIDRAEHEGFGRRLLKLR